MTLLLFIAIAHSEPTVPIDDGLIDNGQATVDQISINGSEIKGTALQLSNSNLKINADRFELDVMAKKAIFTENVEIHGPRFIMRADQVVLQKDSQDEQTIEANGNVYVEVMESSITASRATYWPSVEKIVLSSSVVLDSNEQILRGEVIEIEIEKAIRCQQNCSIQWK